MARWPWSVVAFEAPRRLPRALSVLARVVPDRPAAVCRELTKRFEEVVVSTLPELASRFGEAPKGEVTIVVGPAPVAGADEGGAADAVAELVAAGVPRRAAADVVARLTGVPRNQLYRSSL